MKLAVRLAALALDGPSLAMWHGQRLVSAARAATLGVILAAAFGGGGALAQEPAQIREAQAIAEEAYLYGFPMIVNYKVMYEYATTSHSSR